MGCGNKELLQTSERSGVRGGWERGRRKRNLATAPTCLADEGQGRAKDNLKAVGQACLGTRAHSPPVGVSPPCTTQTGDGGRYIQPRGLVGPRVGRPCDDGAVCDGLGLGRKTLPAALKGDPAQRCVTQDPGFMQAEEAVATASAASRLGGGGTRDPGARVEATEVLGAGRSGPLLPLHPHQPQHSVGAQPMVSQGAGNSHGQRLAAQHQVLVLLQGALQS